MNNLDPTICFGYLIKDYQDYLDFEESINQINEGQLDKVLEIKGGQQTVEELGSFSSLSDNSNDQNNRKDAIPISSSDA